MTDSKTRSDILLEERIAQIDDINFDKIYDIEEFATKQIESFDDVDATAESFVNNQNISSCENFSQPLENQPVFEMEVQPNEFLDNYVWQEDKEEFVDQQKPKFHVANKPLFFTFTSIAVLLCILFIYNVFVINSLEASVSKSNTALNANNANISYVVEEENNYILFDNSTKLEIQNNNAQFSSEDNLQQTYWFDLVCTYVNTLFGGSY